MRRGSNGSDEACGGHLSQKDFHVMLDLLPLPLEVLFDNLNDFVLAARLRNRLPD
jgi:hypothetical protein